jgi:hypothetical protein
VPTATSSAATSNAPNNDASTNVDLQFEVVPPAQSGQLPMLVQLAPSDGLASGDAASTFSELQPGEHTARVTLLDSHNRPLRGGSATVRLNVREAAKAAAPNATAGSDASRIEPATPQELRGAEPGLPVPPELQSQPDQEELPVSTAPLPIVSFIGFALLIGGTISAMRAHKVRSAHSHSH